MSDSKKPVQTAVLYHYCGLSRFFWIRRYLVLSELFWSKFCRGKTSDREFYRKSRLYFAQKLSKKTIKVKKKGNRLNIIKIINRMHIIIDLQPHVLFFLFRMVSLTGNVTVDEDGSAEFRCEIDANPMNKGQLISKDIFYVC